MRVSWLAIATAVALALVTSSGCSNSSDVQQLNQNEFALRGMIASDRQQIDSLQNQIRRLNDEIAQIKHNGETASSSAGAASGDVTDRLARLESEISAMQAALPTVPSAPPVGTDTGVGPPPPGIARSPAAGPAPSSSAASADAAVTWPQDADKELAAAQSSREPGAKLYRTGLTAMKSANYPSAVVDFAKIQHNYPKSPLSEGAEYFAANALYESGKYDQAILQFNDLVMRFPRGQFSCQALLREGQAFLKLNDSIDARLTLQKLASNNACGAESAAANNMLKRLASD